MGAKIDRGAFDKRAAYDAVFRKASPTLNDFDIEAFAEGVLARRDGLAFSDNPYGGAEVRTLARLSWAYGWNERALRQR